MTVPPRKTAAEKQRERLMAAATRRTEPDAAPPGRTAVRSKPVRITVDLPPEQYRALTRWTTEAAADLDRARLPLADVVRAFIHALDEPKVSEEVKRALTRMLT